jgi:hypothetical protein
MNWRIVVLHRSSPSVTIIFIADTKSAADTEPSPPDIGLQIHLLVGFGA